MLNLNNPGVFEIKIILSALATWSISLVVICVLDHKLNMSFKYRLNRTLERLVSIALYVAICLMLCCVGVAIYILNKLS